MGSVENEQKELTRRQFVKGTAVGGVAGLVVTPPFYSAELALTCTNTQGGPKHKANPETVHARRTGLLFWLPVPRGQQYSRGNFLWPDCR